MFSRARTWAVDFVRDVEHAAVVRVVAHRGPGNALARLAAEVQLVTAVRRRCNTQKKVKVNGVFKV